MEPKSPLKVIIVGGSISGLTLAHSLDRANIDYEVLDGHEIAPPVGASIAVFQNGCMVLDQLGLYNDLRALVHPLRTMNLRVQSGRAIKTGLDGLALEERFGYSVCLLPRQRLIQLLYDHLTDKSKVHAGRGKRVVRVTHSDTGVEVLTEDGSTYHGDVVAACDGIHSTVRSEMWQNADSIQPGKLSEDKHCELKVLLQNQKARDLIYFPAFASDYTCLFGIADPVDGLPAGESNIICANPASFLTFIGSNGEVYFFLYHKMDKSHTWPDCPRFSKGDAESMANVYKSSKITDNVTFGDIWKKQKTFTLLPMEEGVLKNWCWGRFAIVGDAAHKMTVNIGQGGNCAIEGAAALANSLHSLVTSHRGEELTTAAIYDALYRYEGLQRPRVQEVFDIASKMTRLQGLESPKGYAFLVASLFRATPLADTSSGLFLKTCTLNYLPKPSRINVSTALEATGRMSNLAKNVFSFLIGWSLCYLAFGRRLIFSQ